jgi:hypothetical protein
MNGMVWHVFGVGPLIAYGMGTTLPWDCGRRLKCLSVRHGVAANKLGIDPTLQVAKESTSFSRTATWEHADLKHWEQEQVDHERGFK